MKVDSWTLHVQTMWERPRSSMYYVTGFKRAGQPYPGEVRIGVESIFSCMTCKRLKCIHVEAARAFVASQPLEPIDGTGTAGATNERPF